MSNHALGFCEVQVVADTPDHFLSPSTSCTENGVDKPNAIVEFTERFCFSTQSRLEDRDGVLNAGGDSVFTNRPEVIIVELLLLPVLGYETSHTSSGLTSMFLILWPKSLYLGGSMHLPGLTSIKQSLTPNKSSSLLANLSSRLSYLMYIFAIADEKRLNIILCETSKIEHRRERLCPVELCDADRLNSSSSHFFLLNHTFSDTRYGISESKVVCFLLCNREGQCVVTYYLFSVIYFGLFPIPYEFILKIFNTFCVVTNLENNIIYNIID